MINIPENDCLLVADQMASWFSSDSPLPRVTSLDAETHLFHYTQEWDASRLIFVNKNGNQQRLIKIGVEWYAYSTWRDIWPKDEWEHRGLRGDDPERLIAKMSVGPSAGKRETLCFLPKDATNTQSRILAYRYHLLRLNKIRGTDAFALADTASDQRSPAFSGAPWENLPAMRWCADQLGVDSPPVRMRGVSNPFTREREQEAVATALEENVLFGAWG